MNDQSWWRLTLAHLFFLLWLQSFEIMAYYPWQLPPSISPDKIMSGRYILKVWIFLYLKDWYQSLFCSTYYPRPCIFRKVGTGSLQLFNKWCFSSGNDKTWIYILVIHRWKINHFDCTEHTGLYGQIDYVSLMESKAFEFKFYYYYDFRICYISLCFALYHF